MGLKIKILVGLRLKLLRPREKNKKKKTDPDDALNSGGVVQEQFGNNVFQIHDRHQDLKTVKYSHYGFI